MATSKHNSHSSHQVVQQWKSNNLFFLVPFIFIVLRKFVNSLIDDSVLDRLKILKSKVSSLDYRVCVCVNELK